VLSAVVGLSALHLSALNPYDRLLRYTSSYYMDKAVTNHRTALAHVNDSSAEPLLATAILITHYSWLAGHIRAPNETYELPSKTYHMAKGIQKLFTQMAPSIRESGLLWYVEKLPEHLSEDYESVDDIHRSEFFDHCKHDLDMISRIINCLEIEPGDKTVYDKTVAQLAFLYSLIRNGAPQSLIQRQVATLPVMLPDRFLEMVESYDPLALALLARNLAMLKIIERTWWLHGNADHEVGNFPVRGIKTLMPKEWDWAMEWPLHVVNAGMNLVSASSQKTAIFQTGRKTLDS
jgi:hypothetical protein